MFFILADVTTVAPTQFKTSKSQAVLLLAKKFYIWKNVLGFLSVEQIIDLNLFLRERHQGVGAFNKVNCKGKKLLQFHYMGSIL